jgi:sec-independent protein translocase protein TatC
MQLPASSSMIATDVTATFMAPFKLNLFVAIVLAMPFILYQLWLFIKPALYARERYLALPLLVGSIVLFLQALPLLISSPCLLFCIFSLAFHLKQSHQ